MSISSDLYLNPDNHELRSFLNSDVLSNSMYVFEDIDPDVNLLNSQKSVTRYYTPIQLRHFIKKTNEFSILHVGIKYKVIEKLTTAVENLFECISVELSLDRKVIVSCVYRQPGSSIEEFTNCIDNMFATKSCSLYLCGDFNINLLNYDNHSGTKFFVDHDFLFTMSLLLYLRIRECVIFIAT